MPFVGKVIDIMLYLFSWWPVWVDYPSATDTSGQQRSCTGWAGL